MSKTTLPPSTFNADIKQKIAEVRSNEMAMDRDDATNALVNSITSQKKIWGQYTN